MALLFLNGGGMQGGPLHHNLQDAPLVRTARSAPKYRYFSVGDRFPAMQEVSSGGYAVLGEVYDVTLEILHDHLVPSEPDELELGIIQLDDGTACLATVLRKDFHGAENLVDISEVGDWRQYLANLGRESEG